MFFAATINNESASLYNLSLFDMEMYYIVTDKKKKNIKSMYRLMNVVAKST